MRTAHTGATSPAIAGNCDEFVSFISHVIWQTGAALAMTSQEREMRKKTWVLRSRDSRRKVYGFSQRKDEGKASVGRTVGEVRVTNCGERGGTTRSKLR